MAIPTVTITSASLSPSVKTVRVKSVIVGIKVNNDKTPDASSSSITQVQTICVENPTYTLPNIILTGESSTLTYEDVVTLSKIRYNGSNAPTLSVTWGMSGSNSLTSFGSGSSSIPVLIDSVTLPLDVTVSTNSYRPTLSITFTETA